MIKVDITVMQYNTHSALIDVASQVVYSSSTKYYDVREFYRQFSTSSEIDLVNDYASQGFSVNINIKAVITNKGI